MAWYSDLIKDHDAQNWVKAMYSLKITKNGMHEFVNDELVCVHRVIYTKSTKGLTEGSNCKDCSTKSLTGKNTKQCPNKICHNVCDEIKQQHRHSNPSWINTNAVQWWESSWEIGKCFLPRSGYTNKSSIEECDFNGLCSVLQDCKHFWGKLSFDMQDKDKNFLKEILDIVNDDMRHSASLKVTDDELKVLLDKLRALLSDPKELANRGKAKDAIKELDNVQKDDFILSSEETESILKKDLRLRLASHYRDNLADMPISPIRPDWDAQLSMFYVTPKIVKKNHRKPETAGIEVTTYKDLFGPELQKNNIFLVGEPGLGKSTFSANCALQWSRRHVRMDTKETMQRNTELFCDTDYFESVEFLFHIKLRDACEFCDLNEIIKDQIIAQIYQPNDVDAGYAIAQKVLENHNCIIIVDGLDEWTHPTDRSCRCPRDEKGLLPFRNSAIKANILITTRPWRISKHIVKDSKIDKYLEINGASDVHELVDNVLSVLNAKTGTGTKRSKDFFICVQTLGIDKLLSLPIITMQLVCMWFEDMTISSSLCDTYAAMIDMLFGRCSDHSIQLDEKKMPDCFSNKNNITGKHKVLIKLCRLAFITLFSREDKSAVVFEETTVKNEMLEDDKMVSLKSGIITERKSNSLVRESSHFSFIHKTFQEFLAAVHLYLNEEEYENTVKSRHSGDSGKNVLDISQVFIFICGMKPDLGIQMSSWIGESIPKTSVEGAMFGIYIYKIPRPYFGTSLMDMIVSGYREAENNNHHEIPLTLTRFEIGVSIDEDAVKQLMQINKCRVQSLRVYIMEDKKCNVSEKELQEVFTSSSDSLTAVELHNIGGQYDLSKCQRLQYLNIGINTTISEQVDTRNITTCRLFNVSSNVEKDIIRSLNGTDRVSQLQHLILIAVKDIKLLCDTLPNLSQLQYINICDTNLREHHLLPPASITCIDLYKLTMTAGALRMLVERMEKIRHTVKCAINECSVEPASSVERVKEHVEESNLFTLETYKWSPDVSMRYSLPFKIAGQEWQEKEEREFVFESNAK